MSKSKQSVAEQNVDRAESLYDELKNVHGCDPFAIMAAFAVGDAVKLKLISRERRDSAGGCKFVKDPRTLLVTTQRVPSGAELELDLIPPKVRFDAAKELAGYCRPKLAATTFLGADGKVATSNVIVYVPDNGRGPQ